MYIVCCNVRVLYSVLITFIKIKFVLFNHVITPWKSIFPFNHAAINACRPCPLYAISDYMIEYNTFKYENNSEH